MRVNLCAMDCSVAMIIVVVIVVVVVGSLTFMSEVIVGILLFLGGFSGIKWL